MLLDNYSDYKTEDGVIILSEINDEFESEYIALRKKEKRLYSNDEIKILPFASKINPHKNEWELRAKSFLRFKYYLQNKSKPLEIMDLGCGNGWFSAQLSKVTDHSFSCVDVNFTELKQGAGLFNSNKLKFIYADVFEVEFPKSFFDLIILNSSLQYFESVNSLTKQLFNFINPDGEIHIIDSPIYKEKDAQSAKQRSEKYFLSIGFNNMSKFYFHHTVDEFKEFNFQVAYNPDSLMNRLIKSTLSNDSPFPWIIIKR